jgi:hypothetical protein
MYRFRVLFGAVTRVFALITLLTFAPTGCERAGVPGGRGSRTLTCATRITVDSTQAAGVDKSAVYVCGGDNLQWDNPNNVTFTVHFTKDCPFTSCSDISDNSPQLIKPLPAVLTVYHYTITIVHDNQTIQFDPHVVGGGA